MGFASDGQRVASGRTPQLSTNWQVYTGSGIFVDVDTTAAKFTGNPVYLTSIGGVSSHWSTIGATSIYPIGPGIQPGTGLPTATGFRVYVQWADRTTALTPAQAKGFGWHINWIGYEQP